MIRRPVASILAAFFLVAASPSFATEEKVIDAPTAHEQMRAGALTLIDVRSPEEWQETGIARGAVPISIHDPDGPQTFLKKVTKAVKGDKSQPVGLICATGIRSTFAGRMLLANGFDHVFNVKEGMLGRRKAPGWIERGLPVEPCQNCTF